MAQPSTSIEGRVVSAEGYNELQDNSKDNSYESSTITERDEELKCNSTDELAFSFKPSNHRKDSDTSITSSQNPARETSTVKVSENFTSVPYGFQLRAAYDHGKEHTDIMGVVYNVRMRQFVILDARGITAWNRSIINSKVTRCMSYPKYEYSVITNIIFVRKYNCYFALGKDFSLKVLNKDFEETLSVSADLRSVLFMVFNPVTDQLITGGVGGTKIWEFHQVASHFKELRAMANYRLTLKAELPNVGGSWVKRVELDQHRQHLYCCSDTDLYGYDLQGKLLFQFLRAHNMSITACKYSIGTRFLITSSLDCEVKVWSQLGGLIHTFRGHSRAVTDTIIHPDSSFLILTSSLDGTVRLWSLETMDVLYSHVVSVDGVLWMGLTDENLLYASTVSSLTVWSLNDVYSFWGLARNSVSKLCLTGCPNKTTRVMASCDDGSVRLFARSSQRNISTVLPPPSLSPMETVLSVTYNRHYNVTYLLMKPTEIWVYTTRTDPACRAAIWDVIEIQKFSEHNTSKQLSKFPQAQKAKSFHRASVMGSGNEAVANCLCLCVLASTAMVWTDEGMSSPLQNSFLLLGLEDGRILFMDPVVKNRKHMEFKASKDKVLDIQHDLNHQFMVTCCQQKEHLTIQMWNLPRLELQHEICVTPDICKTTICGSVIFCGHSNGCIIHHELVKAEDFGLYSTKAVPTLDELKNVSTRPDHQGAIIALDSCPALKIVCSASPEGAIKIWDSDKVLLTEIALSSLDSPSEMVISSACFLNNQGDLLVGYLNHIFMVDHTKVCPSIHIPEIEEGYCDAESAVLEDSRVLYDDAQEEPDVIDLQKYLVPFDIALSADFFEGLKKIEPIKQTENDEKEEVLDAKEDVFGAPSEIYLSPVDTPCQLSAVDLLLGADLDQQDLQRKLSSFKKTKKRRPKSSVHTAGGLTPDVRWVEMPKFGISPGPSPSPSESSIDSVSTVQPSVASQREPGVEELSDKESISYPEQTSATAEKKTVPEPTFDKAQVKPTVSKALVGAPTQASLLKSRLPSEDSRKSKYSLEHIKLDLPKTKARPLRPSNRSPVIRPASPTMEMKAPKPKREIKKKVLSGVRKTVTKRGERRKSLLRRDSEAWPNVGSAEEDTNISVSEDTEGHPVGGARQGKIEPVCLLSDDESITNETRIMIPSIMIPQFTDTSADVSFRDAATETSDGVVTPADMAVKEEINSVNNDDINTNVDDTVNKKGTPPEESGETDDEDTFPGFRCTFRKPEIKDHSLTDRPTSAADVSEEEHLWSLFNAAIRHYRQRPGTPGSNDLWFRNPGNSFEDNWHERIIERHHLLKLQKNVRAQSAVTRRSQAEQKQQEKRQPRQNICDTGKRGFELDASLHILQSVERANHVPTSTQCQERRTRRRPRTANAKLQGVDKQLLSAEHPFRLRMNKSLTDTTRSTSHLHRELLLSSFDPRNPKSVRPQSSKSIPAKCSKYVLVQPPKEEGNIVASPMAEQLLRKRFPSQYTSTLISQSGSSSRLHSDFFNSIVQQLS